MSDCIHVTATNYSHCIISISRTTYFKFVAQRVRIATVMTDSLDSNPSNLGFQFNERIVVTTHFTCGKRSIEWNPTHGTEISLSCIGYTFDFNKLWELKSYLIIVSLVRFITTQYLSYSTTSSSIHEFLHEPRNRIRYTQADQKHMLATGFLWNNTRNMSRLCNQVDRVDMNWERNYHD